jgi:hypothetical protein
MKNKIFIFSFIILLAMAAAWVIIYPLAWQQIAWRQATKAAYGSYQVGIINATVTQCELSCCSPAGCRCCTGGTLCSTITTEAECILHSDINGTKAGGKGNNILESNINIAAAGLSSGGQLIAAGMGPTLMDSGVIISRGGCSGCTAKADVWDKIGGVYDYIIASFKED